MNKLIKIITLASASLMLASCGGSVSTSESSSSSSSSSVNLPDGVCLKEGTFKRGETAKVGQPVYDLTLTAIDGSELTFSTLLEEYDAIYLNFTYTSCYWCGFEAPFINEVYANGKIGGTDYKYSEKVAFIGFVDPKADGASDEYCAEFVEEEGFAFPFVIDHSNYSYYFPVDGYPSSFMIDRYGYLAKFTNTFTDTSKCEEFLDSVLGDDYVPSYVK